MSEFFEFGKISFCLLVCLSLIGPNSVQCGNSALFPNDDHQNHRNSTADNRMAFDGTKLLKRDKRYLLWTGGGISKLILGILAPVETRDQVNWRTLNLAYNFQFQYVPLPSTQYLWTFFSRNLRDQRKAFDETGLHQMDMTRELLYGAIEFFLDSKGKPGRQCLLKSICDATEHPIVQGGIFEEIVHLILTPNVDDRIENDYTNARLAGEFGGDCAALYNQCHYGDGLLDRISHFEK